MNITNAEMIDAQARVIRSLNLIHCEDTKYMVGAAQLEILLKIKDEYDVLKSRVSMLEMYQQEEPKSSGFLGMFRTNQKGTK